MRVRNPRHPGKTCLTAHGSIKLDAEGYAEVSDEAAKSLAASGWELAPVAPSAEVKYANPPAVLVPDPPPPEPKPKEEEKPAPKKEYTTPAPVAQFKKKGK